MTATFYVGDAIQGGGNVTQEIADRLNHAFRQGYAAAIVAKEGGESRTWVNWCVTHNSEQVREGDNICFRSPTVFPTVEAELHRCRMDRRVLISMPPEEMD